MPGTDLALDPVTHDLVDDGHGDWKEDATIAPQVQHQVLDHRGLWFADPGAGSVAHTIPRKANEANVLAREDAYRDALRVFIETGLAEDLVLETSHVGPGRIDWRASLVDVQHGQLDLTPLLSFGVGEA